jgi:cell division protein ZapA
MVEAAVPLKVAGQTYRVVTSAPVEELERLAKVVEAALGDVTPKGRQPSPQALVLAAITLAHELEEERARRVAVEERHRRVLGSLIGKIDRVLSTTPPGEVAPAAQQQDAAEVLVRSKSSARLVELKRGE